MIKPVDPHSRYGSLLLSPAGLSGQTTVGHQPVALVYLSRAGRRGYVTARSDSSIQCDAGKDKGSEGHCNRQDGEQTPKILPYNSVSYVLFRCLAGPCPQTAVRIGEPASARGIDDVQTHRSRASAESSAPLVRHCWHLKQSAASSEW